VKAPRPTSAWPWERRDRSDVANATVAINLLAVGLAAAGIITPVLESVTHVPSPVRVALPGIRIIEVRPAAAPNGTW